MAKYDASGDRIKSRFPVFSTVVLILGIILLAAGIIYYKNTDMSKYYKMTDISESYDAGGINNIDIDFGIGDILIDKSGDENIHVEGINIPEYVEVETSGDIFKIKRQKKNFNFWDFPLWNLGSGKNEISLKIYLPDKTYNNFKLDCGVGTVEVSNVICSYAEFDIGAGDCDINSFICDNASIDTGAGDCDISFITVNKTLEINNGAGDMTIENGVLGGIEIDSGAGDVDFSGTINGDIEADVGAGDCTFTLTNPESDYRFEGDGRKHYGSSGGKYTVDIDSGAGDIDFIFGK